MTHPPLSDMIFPGQKVKGAKIKMRPNILKNLWQNIYENYIKSSIRVFADYGIALLFFVIFLYGLISMAGYKTPQWLPVYSFLTFLICYGLLYSEMKAIAAKEKKGYIIAGKADTGSHSRQGLS